MSRAVVISAVRTPVGRYGGAPSGIRLAALRVGVGQGHAALFERAAN